VANFEYNYYKRRRAVGEVDFLTDTIRWRLEMSNSTAGTDYDIQDLASLSTPDEFNGTGYTAKGEALATKSILLVTGVSGSAAMDAANVQYASLSGGDRNITQAILHRDGGTGGSSEWPMAHFDQGGFNFAAPGAPVDFIFPVAGLFIQP